PAEGAGTARSKAVLELTLIVLSGEKQGRTAFALAFAFAFVGVGLPVKAAFGPTGFGWVYAFFAAASISPLSLRAVRRFGRARVRAAI
ncbi:hypothetical protein, partial [Pseudomonas koreensis]